MNVCEALNLPPALVQQLQIIPEKYLVTYVFNNGKCTVPFGNVVGLWKAVRTASTFTSLSTLCSAL